MKILMIYSLFVLLLFGSMANTQAETDILDVQSALLPLREKGQAWEHPSVTITGEGELKIKDGTVDVVYEGEITCDVAASADTHKKNKVEIQAEKGFTEVEAKSKKGTIDISNCTITDEVGVISTIDQDITVLDGKIKIEIEGFGEDINGGLVFSEYEAKGKVENGKGPKVELELEDGMIKFLPPYGFDVAIYIDDELQFFNDSVFFTYYEGSIASQDPSGTVNLRISLTGGGGLAQFYADYPGFYPAGTKVNYVLKYVLTFESGYFGTSCGLIDMGSNYHIPGTFLWITSEEQLGDNIVTLPEDVNNGFTLFCVTDFMPSGF